MTHAGEVHHLIRVITDYLKAFHDHQKELFPTIDGILVLDDIIGFISKEQFVEFGLPYFREIYNRNLGPDTPFSLPRGPNQPWSDAGLLYSPPFR
jgi:hypothetical protein